MHNKKTILYFLIFSSGFLTAGNNIELKEVKIDQENIVSQLQECIDTCNSAQFALLLNKHGKQLSPGDYNTLQKRSEQKKLSLENRKKTSTRLFIAWLGVTAVSTINLGINCIWNYHPGESHFNKMQGAVSIGGALGSIYSGDQCYNIFQKIDRVNNIKILITTAGKNE